MDFKTRQQWRSHDSDQQKQPSALPLFASEPTTNLSPFFSDHKITSTFISLTLAFLKVFFFLGLLNLCVFFSVSGMGSYFSLSQWQELELQALIFRHMISGADVPSELLHLVKKSVVNSPYYHYFPHYQPSRKSIPSRFQINRSADEFWISDFDFFWGKNASLIWHYRDLE